MTSLISRLRPYRWLVAAIALLTVLHIAILPITPPGLYVDEAASGAQALALLHHGTDAHGHAWPLFTASLGGGYTTPVYLYPLAGWIGAFGPSELSLRAFSLFVTLFACLFLGAAVRKLLGSTAYGLVAMAVSLALPWGWLQGSLVWDPAMVPLFVALSLWMFSVLLQPTHRGAHKAATVIMPLSLIALAYVYPPCRVTAPLLMALYYGILLWRHAVSIRHVTIIAVASLALVIPLALFMIQPDALERSQALSVFHGRGAIAGIGILILNVLSLINPLFLFVTGDANLRHSTGLQGMLGLAAILPIGAVLWVAVRYRATWRIAFTRPHPAHLTLLVAICGIAASLLGSALTAEGQPHSLRASAAWPFYVLVITLGWRCIAAAPERVARTAIALAICGTVLYVADLSFLYPHRAAEAFDVSQRQAILNHTPVAYPELALDYYRWR